MMTTVYVKEIDQDNWKQAMPDCREVFTSYKPENDVAARLYRSLGFEHTGRIEDGELVVRLSLAKELVGVLGMKQQGEICDQEKDSKVRAEMAPKAQCARAWKRIQRDPCSLGGYVERRIR